MSYTIKVIPSYFTMFVEISQMVNLPIFRLPEVVLGKVVSTINHQELELARIQEISKEINETTFLLEESLTENIDMINTHILGLFLEYEYNTQFYNLSSLYNYGIEKLYFEIKALKALEEQNQNN